VADILRKAVKMHIFDRIVTKVDRNCDRNRSKIYFDQQILADFGHNFSLHISWQGIMAGFFDQIVGQNSVKTTNFDRNFRSKCRSNRILTNFRAKFRSNILTDCQSVKISVTIF